MKKKFKSRLRSDLFPDMPQSFQHRISAVLPVQNAGERRRRAWLSVATVAAGAIVAACYVLVIIGALQNRRAHPAAPDVQDTSETIPILDTWELKQFDYNGVLLSAAYLGYSDTEITFYEDGTAQVSGQALFHTMRDGAAASYTIDGQRIMLFVSDDPNDGGAVTLTYDPGQDTLTAENLTVNMSMPDTKATFRRKSAIPEPLSTMLGRWYYSYSSYSPDVVAELTIEKDGSAIFRTYSYAGSGTLPLTYTVEFGMITFTGDGESFTAVYLAEEDALSVTRNGVTLKYLRASLKAEGTWTMTEMILDDGTHVTAKEAGVKSTLEFKDGTLTDTWNVNGSASQTEYRYLAEGNSVLLRRDGVSVNDPEITYDPETDTLRLFTADDGRTCVFVRMPDLVGKWTVTGVELNGSPDTSGSWMHEEYLEFSGPTGMTILGSSFDGSVTRTEYDASHENYQSEQYRYRVSGNTVELQKDDGSAHETLTYDPATDTLRRDRKVFYSNPHAPDDDVVTSIFSRTPDAEIPSPAPEKTDDNIVTSDEDLAALRAKYPEYFDLDTESGLKVFVCEFACDSFSCTLLSGKDKDKSLVDISVMRGTTVGEMLSILISYDIPSEKIEVIPYVNPLSSYAYTIDALYTSYVTWKIKGGLPYLDAVQFDLDGDGIEELCTLTYGPTSGLFTVTFSVYREGKLLAMNTFNLHYGELYFSKTAEGLKLLHTSQWADSAPQTDVYLVTIQSGRIVWTNEKTGEAFTDYWGDGSWNLNGRDPASIDVSGVTVSSRYLCVGATAGDTLVPIPEEYHDHTHGLELAENDPQNAADGFVWVKRSYLTAVGSGLSDQAWGSLAPSEGDAPSALRLETELTAENGEPIVLHFALCEQPMEYGFLDEGVADAGPLVPEPTAETLFFADWDEDGVYEYLAYLKLPESGKCLISDGERTLVLEDCVTVRGFYTDLDTKSPYGNLIFSIEGADGSEHVYELRPEGDAIVIGNTRNGYCFVDDGTLTEDEPYDLCIGEPSPFGSAHGYYTVHGDALEPWGRYRVALELDDFDVSVQRDRDRLIKDGLLLKLKLDMPCTLNGEKGLLEAGTYVYLVSYLDTFTEAGLSTEDGLVVTVTMNGDANDLRIDGVPVSDYFE